jgi:hypothetical protein
MVTRNVTDDKKKNPAKRASEMPPPPPNDKNHEESLLGSLLWAMAKNDASAFNRIIETGITTADFFYPTHAEIFDVVMSMAGDVEIADAGLIIAKIKKRGLKKTSDEDRIVELTESVPHALAGPYHARQVIDLSIKRRALSWADTITHTAHNGATADELLAEVHRIGQTAEGITAGSARGGLIVRKADEIEQQAVRWFWADRFVAGAINLLIGMPDQGKSVVTCDFAARKTTGTPWPYGSNTTNDAGSVAFLAVEDSPETTIVPRLYQAGADLTRVHIVEGVHRYSANGGLVGTFDLSEDVAQLEQLRKRDPSLSLVIIDPLDSYIGKVDTRVGNDVRRALWPLKNWCEKMGVTAIVVHHFNKASSSNAIDRVSGSRSFGALPRSVWMIAKDQHHDDRSIMVPIKLNLTRERAGMAYEIRPSVNNPAVPIIAWVDGQIHDTAEDLLGNDSKSKTDEAADFLREVLTAGPMPTDELKQNAREAGLSWRTLEKAKQRAGAESYQQRDGGKVAAWFWTLKGRR